jgi:hypothetical protein
MTRSLPLFVIAAMAVSGCTFSQVPVATPTLVPVTSTAAATQTPPPTVTLSPAPTTQATEQPLIAPTNTPPPATATLFPTSTPGPFEHEVAPEDTLGFIIQQYGHDFSFDAIDAVVRINENIPNRDSLPSPGTVILVPRPTEIVAVADAEGDTDEEDDSPAPQQESLAEQVGDLFTMVHRVREGETIIDIAQQYSTTLEIISQLNPDVPFFGCNFEIPSGGPDCVISIQIEQEINVPAPSPTPTLSPTPDGNETATPTPTYVAPMAVFPPNGGIAQPGRLRLQWVSAGVLKPGEVYLVYVKNATAGGQINAFTTRSTTYQLPADLIPRDGQTNEFEWWVTVGRQNDDGLYEDISGLPDVQTFQWQSAG